MILFLFGHVVHVLFCGWYRNSQINTKMLIIHAGPRNPPVLQSLGIHDEVPDTLGLISMPDEFLQRVQ